MNAVKSQLCFTDRQNYLKENANVQDDETQTKWQLRVALSREIPTASLEILQLIRKSDNAQCIGNTSIKL